MARLATRISVPARIGATNANIHAIRPPSRNAITKANIIIKGARTAILVSIINAFWTFVTSVVILVTRELVENLSILSKEKSLTASYISIRRFLPNPQLAVAHVIPASIPNIRLPMAIIARMPPKLAISDTLAPSLIRLTSSAI